MNENDRVWYENKVVSYEGTITGDNWWGNHCEFSPRSQCGRGTNSTPTNVFYEMVGSAWESSWIYGKVSPNHESVHIYQKSIIGDGMYRVLPPWFGEGQANFLGFVTSSRFLDVKELRKAAINDLQRPFPNYLRFDSTDWLSAINQTDSDINFCVSNGLGYSLGMLISEYLYLKFSPDQIDHLLSDVARGVTWDEAVLANFGLSEDQLYRGASEYISTEVLEIRPR